MKTDRKVAFLHISVYPWMGSQTAKYLRYYSLYFSFINPMCGHMKTLTEWHYPCMDLHTSCIVVVVVLLPAPLSCPLLVSLLPQIDFDITYERHGESLTK